MANNPRFTRLLHDMAQLHDRKNHDYAKDADPYSNFREAALVAQGFDGLDAVFAALIGVKLARLRELKASGKAPKNESIHDTLMDLAMYAALWASATLPMSYDDLRLGQNYDHTGAPV